MERSLMLAQKYQHLNTLESRAESQEDSAANPGIFENVARLPTAKVKSGAVESLLSQNEDLAARLKVLLRRLASVEDENLRLSLEHREMKHQLSGVSDQLSVYRDKESKWRERTLTAEETLDIQNSQIRQKEIEFAKLRSQEWELREHLKAQLEKITRSNHLHLRYRARIKNWVSPSLKSKTQLVHEKNLKMEQLRRELLNTEVQSQGLIHKNLEQLRKVREELRQVEDEKIQIIGQFEVQRKDLTREIETLTLTLNELRKKAALVDRSLERQDYLENRLILAERTNEELRSKFNEEFSSIQEQLYDWRGKAQSFELERDSLLVQKTELDQQLKRTKEVANRLDEQMEALRLLWKDKVHENERLKQTQQALEGINSDLSLKMNELRTQLTLTSNS